VSPAFTGWLVSGFTVPAGTVTVTETGFVKVAAVLPCSSVIWTAVKPPEMKTPSLFEPSPCATEETSRPPGNAASAAGSALL
jgi:hypothetical protein